MDIFSKIPSTLDVTLYGNLEQVTDTLSKCRVRIFYKGMNRNRTFISEDFANQLIESLPYAPIKGIFNKDKVDYEDHGEDNTDGRIYGIIPENPNFAWEKNTDIDGIVREYASADVFLFTGLYPEAKIIPGESQSMEIFKPTLEGEWRISDEDGKPYYYFKKGCLVGLQVLGVETEPCFEGSAFFSKIKQVEDIIKSFTENYNLNKEGEKEMDKSIFRLSDNEKYDLIFEAINPGFDYDWENNEDKYVYSIMEVYDDYALCRKRKENKFVRIPYQKDNVNNTVSVGEPIDVFIVDVTESEYNALNAMKAANGSFEASLEAYNNAKNTVETLTAEKESFEKTVEELNGTVADFEATKTQLENTISEKENTITEKDEKISEFEAQIKSLTDEKVELNNKISDITNENQTLAAFKAQIEKEKKEEILTKYEQHLSESAIETFKNDIDKYTIDDFKKEVCTAAVEADPSIFERSEPDKYYKGSNSSDLVTGAIKILNKYKNGGNK